MPDIERKTIRSEFKEGDSAGSFTAQFVTFDVPDLDGDVTVRGAFPEGKEIIVSAYQHGSWMGALPVGKAVIHERDSVAVAEGQFNLNMTTGRETYESVKFSGDLQEYSYGFRVLEVGDEKEVEAWAKAHDGARPLRIIKSVDPFEISPVLKGAGIDTQTLDIKSGLPYADEAEAALAAVNAVVARTKSLADLRRKEGRDLSPANRERIAKLSVQFGEVKAELDRLVTVTEPTDCDRKAIDAAYLRFVELNCKLTEVR
jgi:phage head maturation protease